MLSSAQDYHPGAKGSREHIWQATLGPAAVVFVTHPANSSERDAVARVVAPRRLAEDAERPGARPVGTSAGREVAGHAAVGVDQPDVLRELLAVDDPASAARVRGNGTARGHGRRSRRGTGRCVSRDDRRARGAVRRRQGAGGCSTRDGGTRQEDCCKDGDEDATHGDHDVLTPLVEPATSARAWIR